MTFREFRGHCYYGVGYLGAWFFFLLVAVIAFHVFFGGR